MLLIDITKKTCLLLFGINITTKKTFIWSYVVCTTSHTGLIALQYFGRICDDLSWNIAPVKLYTYFNSCSTQYKSVEHCEIVVSIFINSFIEIPDKIYYRCYAIYKVYVYYVHCTPLGVINCLKYFNFSVRHTSNNRDV